MQMDNAESGLPQVEESGFSLAVVMIMTVAGLWRGFFSRKPHLGGVTWRGCCDSHLESRCICLTIRLSKVAASRICQPTIGPPFGSFVTQTNLV